MFRAVHVSATCWAPPKPAVSHTHPGPPFLRGLHVLSVAHCNSWPPCPSGLLCGFYPLLFLAMALLLSTLTPGRHMSNVGPGGPLKLKPTVLASVRSDSRGVLVKGELERAQDLFLRETIHWAKWVKNKVATGQNCSSLLNTNIKWTTTMCQALFQEFPCINPSNSLNNFMRYMPLESPCTEWA